VLIFTGTIDRIQHSAQSAQGEKGTMPTKKKVAKKVAKKAVKKAVKKVAKKGKKK
jgi:hypothetical protein